MEIVLGFVAFFAGIFGVAIWVIEKEGVLGFILILVSLGSCGGIYHTYYLPYEPPVEEITVSDRFKDIHYSKPLTFKIVTQKTSSWSVAPNKVVITAEVP